MFKLLCMRAGTKEFVCLQDKLNDECSFGDDAIEFEEYRSAKDMADWIIEHGVAVHVRIIEQRFGCCVYERSVG